MDIAHLLARRATNEVIVCDVNDRMRDAVSILAARRIGAMPVIRDGEVAGIFSERDVIYCLEAEGEASLDKPVGEVMTAPPITATPGTRIEDALELMTRRRIRHLPVVENGSMCGFVSIGDLVKAQVDAIASEAEAMRVYIQTA
ncbi:histidine kinase [Tsuneonella deserti]|uniref:Histidine kinase n=1 Tax=Tsuneonella deserti TaxID=2035528 RepID=A0ABQ1SCB9_9SPHN|nr:CBS domain-containing protein [Tsuneonella deserti]GGE04075.1 histidine kinase [Tsuneonella deserti]